MIAVDPQPHLWHSLSDGLGAQPSLMLGILVRCMTGANNGGPNSCAVRRAALHAGSKQVAVLSPQGTPAYADESHAGAAPEHLRLQKGGKFEAGWIVFTRSRGCSAGTFSQGRG